MPEPILPQNKDSRTIELEGKVKTCLMNNLSMRELIHPLNILGICGYNERLPCPF